MNERRLARRMERVRVLLRTRHDYLPGVRGSLDTPSGIAESRMVPCPDCRSTGRVAQGKGTFTCRICGGRGWRPKRAGEQTWDEYVGEPVATVESDQPPRAATLRELDQSIAAIEEIFAEREGRYDHERFGWEVGRRVRDRSGSYEQLERLLGTMAERLPSFRTALDRCYTDELVGEGESQAEVWGVRWLAHSMVGPIRIPDWAYDDETDLLVQQVREARKRGVSIPEIAEDQGLSVRRVKALLERNRAAT